MKQDKRKIIQNAFIGVWLIALITIWIGKTHTSHQFCPYASVCFGAMLPNGYTTYLISIIIGLAIAISTIFLGRKFCGSICFFGTIQERIFHFKKSNNTIIIPTTLDFFLKSLKYIIFFGTIYFAYTLAAFRYMNFCPVIALSFPMQITIFGATSLLIIFVGSFIIERFWCRYLCPYAAFMNMFIYLGKILRIKRKVIRVNSAKCISCKLCDIACPMSIKIVNNSQVNDPNCIYCGNCIDKCPKHGIFYK